MTAQMKLKALNIEVGDLVVYRCGGHCKSSSLCYYPDKIHIGLLDFFYDWMSERSFKIKTYPERSPAVRIYSDDFGSPENIIAAYKITLPLAELKDSSLPRFAVVAINRVFGDKDIDFFLKET